MKSKGFTLIELLAVIVILAIIALIATPVVLNIIKDSKNSSIERSAELYLSQVIDEISRYNMNHPGANFNPSECIVQSDDTLICDGTSLNIEINGDKPSVGSKILLSNGKVTGTKKFKIGSKSLTYDGGKFKEGTDKLCSRVTTATTGNVPTGNFIAGDEYICDVGDGEEKTFFVLGTDGDNVSLIMYANVGVDGKAVTATSTNLSKVAWISKEDYIAAGGTESDYGTDGKTDKGPITVTKALKEYTSTWTNLSSSQIALPTSSQLVKIAPYNDSNYSVWLWLSDYLKDSTHPVSGVRGYWLPSYYDSTTAKYVQKGGYFGYSPSLSVNGVRPVITLNKTDLQ